MSDLESKGNFAWSCRNRATAWSEDPLIAKSRDERGTAVQNPKAHIQTDEWATSHVLSNKRVVMMCSTAHFWLARLCYHKDDCSSRREISPYEPAGG